MNIALANISFKGDNKDFNGGFGTTFKIGRSWKSKLLALARSNLEKTPVMSYAYISAIFKKEGNSVKYFENRLPKEFDLCLLHVSLIRHNEELALLKRLKQEKGGKIGVYGPLATSKPELFEDADFVIQGEPEQAIIKIAKTKKIPKGKIKSEPLKDLDLLPFPDYSIFEVNNFSIAPAISLKPAVYVHASRGCPYGCNYCPYLVFGDYRVRAPENVIKELKHLKERYKIKAFYFRDPTFSLGTPRIEKLAKLMIQNRLDLKWGCETRSDLLTPGLLKLLYKSGLRAIKMGVESSDHEMLRKYARIPPKIEHQERIVKFCKKLGIKVIAFYIIGIPSDTKESTERTIKYSQKLNTSFANFTICTPIPGTLFYDQIKEDIFEKDLNKFDNFHIVFKHPHLTGKQIIDLQEKAFTEYYFRIRYFFRYLLDKFK